MIPHDEVCTMYNVMKTEPQTLTGLKPRILSDPHPFDRKPECYQFEVTDTFNGIPIRVRTKMSLTTVQLDLATVEVEVLGDLRDQKVIDVVYAYSHQDREWEYNAASVKMDRGAWGRRCLAMRLCEEATRELDAGGWR